MSLLNVKKVCKVLSAVAAASMVIHLYAPQLAAKEFPFSETEISRISAQRKVIHCSGLKIKEKMPLTILEGKVKAIVQKEFVRINGLNIEQLEINLNKVKDNVQQKLCDSDAAGFSMIQGAPQAVEVSVAADGSQITCIEPLTITFDLSAAVIDQPDIFTLVQYIPQENGGYLIKKLGGDFDQNKKSFSGHIINAGIYGVMKAASLKSVKVTLGEKAGYINHQKNMLTEAPIVVDNKIMVPANCLVEGLGAQMDRDQLGSTVNIELNDKKVSYSLGKEAIERNGCLIVPIKDTAEKLDVNMLWVPSTISVEIVK